MYEHLLVLGHQQAQKMTGKLYVDGFVQDGSNSIANTMELLQPCTKPSICFLHSVTGYHDLV